MVLTSDYFLNKNIFSILCPLANALSLTFKVTVPQYESVFHSFEINCAIKSKTDKAGNAVFL